MNSLFDHNSVLEIKNRILLLQANSPAKWGKMNVAQMLAHCTGGLKMAAGDIHLPRLFIGKLIGPFLKSSYYNNLPFPKNIQTDKALVITDARNFELEKQELLLLLDKFHHGGPTNCTKTPHPFLGKFTPEQWSKGMYKHLDHHLRQFGV